MSIKHLLSRTAKITNSLLGEIGTYTVRKTGKVITGVNVIIDESAEVQTEFGAIGGYDIEAILLKSELASVSKLDVITVDGQDYRINLIKRESTAKYYCSVVKV